MTTEIESLRQQIAEKDAEIERLSDRRCEVCGYAEHHREHTGCLRVQLAASQAREVKLRELIGELRSACDTAMEMTLAARIPECGYFGGIAQTVSYVIEEALSTPPDTDALEEYVMSKLEVVAFHHDDEGLSYENSFTGNVTLYRLKEKTEWQK